MPVDLQKCEEQKHCDNDMLTKILDNDDNQAEVDRAKFEERKFQMQKEQNESLSKENEKVGAPASDALRSLDVLNIETSVNYSK